MLKNVWMVLYNYMCYYVYVIYFIPQGRLIGESPSLEFLIFLTKAKTRLRIHTQTPIYHRFFDRVCDLLRFCFQRKLNPIHS